MAFARNLGSPHLEIAYNFMNVQSWSLLVEPPFNHNMKLSTITLYMEVILLPDR